MNKICTLPVHTLSGKTCFNSSGNYLKSENLFDGELLVEISSTSVTNSDIRCFQQNYYPFCSQTLLGATLG